MCGIAGIIKFTSAAAPNAGALEGMSAALAHRGPDGAGVFVDRRAGKCAGLVHRRLAIIDKAGGRQPMGNEDGAVQVVFNGEIYNHAELRAELLRAGHRFASDHSDTEVLVHGWEEWGTELPARLLGMFAFAIWDMRRNPGFDRPHDTLFLARDRMGQKPLFYATLEDGIVFGSTIPSVLAWPEVPRRVPQEQIAAYLQYGHFGGWETIWRDIAQVRPGYWVRLRHETVDGHRYWSPDPNDEVRPSAIENRTAEEAKIATHFRAHLARTVESQLIADVPIACFLSGGIDSSVIALLMQEAVARQGGGAIHTVAVGFAESGFDETHFAATVAKHIGSRHTRLEVNAGQDVIATLQLLLRQSLGEPFADSSILPTYHLSKAVRQLAPVALAGDGGDELFGGYDRYRAMQLLARWGGMARLLPRSTPVGTLGRRERYRRLAAAARAGSIAQRYARLSEICPPALVGRLAGDAATEPAVVVAESASAFRFGLLHDQSFYLPGDLLLKVDSAAMTEALEVRAPFLDHTVVALANGLPDEALLHGGTSKYILRQAFAGDLPPEILARGKKGFGVPIGTWFRTHLREPLRELLLAQDAFVGLYLDRRAVEEMLREHDAGARDHTHRLFALLMLELWAREFRPGVE